MGLIEWASGVLQWTQQFFFKTVRIYGLETQSEEQFCSLRPKSDAETASIKKESRVIVDHYSYGEGNLYCAHIARHLGLLYHTGRTLVTRKSQLENVCVL